MADVLRLDLLARLALATLLGGVIGWEREASGKPAGLRTNILICVGAALLTDLSIAFSTLARDTGPAWDPSRIAAQIVSGIGFLGAGMIMQAKGTVTGLTTAATLWVVAAIGMTAGAGAYLEATGTTLLVLVILWPLGWVEDRIEASRRGRSIRVILTEAPGNHKPIGGLKVVTRNGWFAARPSGTEDVYKIYAGFKRRRGNWWARRSVCAECDIVLAWPLSKPRAEV